jgi:hypothetical protein
MSAKKAKTLDDFESPKRKAATWDDVGLKVSPGFAGLVDVAAQKKPATKRAASTTTAILGLDTPNRNEKTEMEEKLEAKKRKSTCRCFAPSIQKNRLLPDSNPYNRSPRSVFAI